MICWLDLATHLRQLDTVDRVAAMVRLKPGQSRLVVDIMLALSRAIGDEIARRGRLGMASQHRIEVSLGDADADPAQVDREIQHATGIVAVIRDSQATDRGAAQVWQAILLALAELADQRKAQRGEVARLLYTRVDGA